MERELKYKYTVVRENGFVFTSQVLDIRDIELGSAERWLEINSAGDISKVLKRRQFINSNDADGKEIYEGDILQAPSGNVFEVKWYNEELRWAMYRLDTWYNMNCGILRVIGNIYENPELLNTGA